MAEIQPSGASFGLGADPTVYDGLVKLTRVGSALVYNAALGDTDFRIGGDTDANLFFTDAGNDRVGIGTATPRKKLEVVGDIIATGDVTVEGSSLFVGSGTNTGEVLGYSGGVLIRATGAGTLDVVLAKTDGTTILRAFGATKNVEITNDLDVGGDILVDGGNIGITADPNLLTLAANAFTIDGDLRVQGGKIGFSTDTDMIQLAVTTSVTTNRLLIAADGIELGNTKTFTRGVYVVSGTIDFNDAAPVAIATVGDGYAVVDVYVEVTTTFDGATPLIEVGDGGSITGFLQLGGASPGTLGYYGDDVATRGAYLWDGTSSQRKIYTGADTVDARYSATAPSQGEATIFVVIQKLK